MDIAKFCKCSLSAEKNENTPVLGYGWLMALSKTSLFL